MAMPPIHKAVWDENEEEVARLVGEDGRRLNAQMQQSPWNGCSPLMLAAFISYSFISQDAMVMRLLALGADVEQRDRYGRTPAFYACQGRSPSALSLLLDYGASFDETDDLHHNTLLMDAALDHSTACVAVLVRRDGLDVNAKRATDSSTALHLAAAHQ